jgi:energy-coupling factor transporter ATP-binding protein EcfA2
VVAVSVAHFAKYYSNPRGVDEVINAVGLTDKSSELIRTLSGGQRRRLDVALGIIGSPELLFLDEPTTGFDPEARRAFWALIQDLRKSGATILLTTHYLDEAEALADRVAVINQGKIIEVATPALLGGRATSLATVSWKGANGIQSERTDNPTALAALFKGSRDLVNGAFAAGEGTTFGPGSLAIGGSSIGANCEIGSGVTIDNSIIGDGVKIGDRAQIRDSFILHGSQVAQGAEISSRYLSPTESLEISPT